jgi:hypothetical protein
MFRPFIRALGMLLLLPIATPLSAQEVTGTISGQVTDSTNRAIVGAEVVVLHHGTGGGRKSVTDTAGPFVFTALPIGPYDCSVTHTGFKKAMRKNLELHIGDHVSLKIALEVGEFSDQITIVAEAPRVQTESSEQSGLISGEQVQELQLNGRSFMTLLELLPGVNSDMPDRVDPNTNPLLYINGARNSAASFNIDGGNNSDVIVGSGSLNTFTSVETIAEFKVVTSTFAAEYGRGGFAQVNVVTKGGAKRFHGSLYEFLRNDALDARDFFTHQVLPLKQNHFGYSISGPLVLPGGYNRARNKTFFFFTHEFNLISTRGEALNTTVPTPEERRGDFSGRGPGVDGVFGTPDDPVIDPLTLQGFPNGVIPASRLEPDAVKLINLFPLPNFRGPGAINFTSAAPSQQHWREELIRIDHNFSPSWKIYGRFAQDSAFIRNPYGGSSATSVTTRFPGIGATRATRPGKNLVVNLTSVFSPTLLNEFGFTYAGREITQTPTSQEANRAKLGINIPEIFPENDGNVIPTINLGSNIAALNVSRVWLKQLFNLEFSNNVTKVAGRHIIKTGAIYSYGGNRENPTGPNTNGSFTYTTGFSRNSVANMLLGLPFSYTEAERFVVSHARFSMFEAFLQDDFKATNRLTVNFGLRYSAYFNPHDTKNVLTNFLPSAYDPAKAPRIDPASSSGRPVPGTGDALNGMIIAGTNSPFGKRVTQNNTDLIAPRFGFAWTPFKSRKTAVRGGYGINFTRPLIGTFINNAFDNPPFSRSVTIQTPIFTSPGGGPEAAASVPNVTALGTPMLAPTIQQWSLGVQQELMSKTILGVTYVAAHGTHLFRPFNINNAEAGEAAAKNVHINAVRPFPGYGNITQRESSASSIYHSLQFGLNRRFSGQLSFGTAYTFSKSIDNASSDRGGGDVPPNGRNVDAERAPSDFDRSHVFTANYIWNIPRLVRGGPWKVLLNDWQLSGITRLYSGKPFDVLLSQDVAGIGATQNQRPNLIADPQGPRMIEEWFNRAAFARPASGTFGNMGRNTIRGPGIHKWDLSLFKNFLLREKMRIQFRSEFFNAFNHPSFTSIGTSLSTTASAVNPNINSFAVVTGTRDARVIQFGLRMSF